MKPTPQQLETHLWGAANILRGKTGGQDDKNYILSLMFYERLCDQWGCEADEAIVDILVRMLEPRAWTVSRACCLAASLRSRRRPASSTRRATRR